MSGKRWTQGVAAPRGNKGFRFELYGRFVKMPAGSLGTSKNPASSCDAIVAAVPQSRPAVYIIGIGSRVQKVFCDFVTISDEKEGWALLLKATAGSKVFAYDSRYWTRRNTLNKHTPSADVSAKTGSDAKYPQYNSMEITHLRAHWLNNDGSPSDLVDWRIGPFHPNTAFDLLRSPQTLGDTDTHTATPDFKFDRTFFSSADQGTYSINNENEQGSVRWGYSWRSRSGRIVAMGGIGLSSNSFAMSAGDAYKCCGRGARLGNRAMAVQLFGRYSWSNGAIAHGALGSRANPALGCEELRSEYTTNNAYWVGLGKNIHHVWCDFSSFGSGAWTLLLRTKSSGSTFKYSSKHWTEATTLNEKLGKGISEDIDAKYSAFNERHLTHLLAHWPAGNFWWKHGPLLPQTALEVFSGSTTVLSTKPSTDTMFNNQYFSSTPGSQLYGINLQSAKGSTRA